MKKIFITYGDERFKEALKRIGKEAKQLRIFDKIILYTPKDLPTFIKASPLMAFQKGGGYWIWKPYIIWKTLQNCNDDDIVIYADAGCCLQQSEEWERNFNLMKDFHALVFQYQENVDYNWQPHFHCSSPKIKYWTKKTTIDYFNAFFGNDSWQEQNKIWGGASFFRNQQGKLINQWLTISLLHPELLCDPYGMELNNQDSHFVVHRHDQSILTPLSYYFSSEKGEVLIIPETSESEHNTAAIIAKRLRYIDSIPLKTKIRRLTKKVIGKTTYNFLKIIKCKLLPNKDH
jgi:hypothetical protein